MKICVISSTVFRIGGPGPLATCPLTGYGGLEVIAYHCAAGLAKRGHQVIVVAPDGSEVPGCQMIHTGPSGMHDEQQAYGGDPRRGWQGYWPALLQVDCVIDHSWLKNSLLLKAEGRLKAPCLSVCHAPVDTMFKQLPPVEKPCFVCISDDQKAHFEALWNRPARRVYNGVDADYYKPLGVPRSDRFLFLARFSSIKGPWETITACREAGVGLDMIGDTTITNEPDLARKCQEAADGERIKIVGNQTRGACVWWYSQAHVLVHPVRAFREPFGLAPVEAMLCGCPVIAWRNGAMPETIKDGETGTLVKSEKELIEAIRSLSVNGVADDERKRCREWASQFSIQRMVNGYDELCREAVDGGW